MGVAGRVAISLLRSMSIGNYEVEASTSAIFPVVLKPSKGIEQSKHLIDVSWPFKQYFLLLMHTGYNLLTVSRLRQILSK